MILIINKKEIVNLKLLAKNGKKGDLVKCPLCEQEFIKKSHLQIYCSVKCKQKFSYYQK